MNIEKYITFDLPVPYKNIMIYPITVKEYYEFYTYSNIFMIEKNIIPDPKIISMSELEYIYYTTQNDEKTPYVLLFDRLLSLCLKEDDSFKSIEKSILRYNYDDNKKPFFTIGGKEFFSEDYTNIREIVSNQNMLELPDPTISKEVKDSLEEARKYREKITGSKAGSFEDQLVSLSIATGWTIEYIYSMTIRKFITSIRRMDNLIHYKIYLAASMSGMVEFKDKSFIKHWLTNIDNDDKYSDVSMDLNEMKDKISMESAKK